MKKMLALGLCCLMVILLVGCQQTVTVLSEGDTASTIDSTPTSTTVLQDTAVTEAEKKTTVSASKRGTTMLTTLASKLTTAKITRKTKAPTTQKPTAAPTTGPTAAPKKTFSASEALNIVCIGDSITRNGYWKNNFQGTLDSKHTVNGFGVNGSTALFAGVDGGSRKPKAYVDQSEYQESLLSSPDVVVIMLGTNDSKAINWDYNTPEDFIRDYVEIVRSYQKLSTEPQVFIALPPTAFVQNAPSWQVNNENIENGIIPALYTVAQQTGARVIDTHTANKAYASEFTDGVHPATDAGRLPIARAVSNAIKAIIK